MIPLHLILAWRRDPGSNGASPTGKCNTKKHNQLNKTFVIIHFSVKSEVGVLSEAIK